MKKFIQDMDFQLWDFNNNTHIGEVYSYENHVDILMPNEKNIKKYFSSLLAFGFAKINDNGNVVITYADYEKMTHFNYQR